jgi:hypothetical protein
MSYDMSNMVTTEKRFFFYKSTEGERIPHPVIFIHSLAS